MPLDILKIVYGKNIYASFITSLCPVKYELPCNLNGWILEDNNIHTNLVEVVSLELQMYFYLIML